jgi:hypothetical protein
MDMQGWLASLRPQIGVGTGTWHGRLGAAAMGVAAWSTPASAAPTSALICWRRPLDLARAHGGESMTLRLAMGELSWRDAVRVAELTEHSAHAAPGVLILNCLAENEARPLQGLCGLGRVDDAVWWCVQVHNGDARGVPF